MTTTTESIQRLTDALAIVGARLASVEGPEYPYPDLSASIDTYGTIRVDLPHEESGRLRLLGAAIIPTWRGALWYGHDQLQADYGLTVDGITVYCIIRPEHCEALGLESPEVTP